MKRRVGHWTFIKSARLLRPRHQYQVQRKVCHLPNQPDYYVKDFTTKCSRRDAQKGMHRPGGSLISSAPAGKVAHETSLPMVFRENAAWTSVAGYTGELAVNDDLTPRWVYRALF